MDADLVLQQQAVDGFGGGADGFERFFHDFGVPASELGAMERSTSSPLVQRVVEGSEHYGMFVRP